MVVRLRDLLRYFLYLTYTHQLCQWYLVIGYFPTWSLLKIIRSNRHVMGYFARFVHNKMTMHANISQNKREMNLLSSYATNPFNKSWNPLKRKKNHLIFSYYIDIYRQRGPWSPSLWINDDVCGGHEEYGDMSKCSC